MTLLVAGAVGWWLAQTPAAHAHPVAWFAVAFMVGSLLGRWLEAAR